MKYSTTITSKGTITIAAPLRKALNLMPGQKVVLSLGEGGQIVLTGTPALAEFSALRERIVAKIPPHKKGLTGKALKEAAAQAWTAGTHD